MKKIIIIIFAGVILFALTGCSGSFTGNSVTNLGISELTSADILECGIYDYDKLAISDMSAQNITAANALLDGNVYYEGIRPCMVGVIFGTQQDDSDAEIIGKDMVNHRKNPFDMYYYLNEECATKLTPSTTYYYRFFAVVDTNGDNYFNSDIDKIVISEQHSFTSLNG